MKHVDSRGKEIGQEFAFFSDDWPRIPYSVLITVLFIDYLDLT
jgi:hypothetical protein